MYLLKKFLGENSRKKRFCRSQIQIHYKYLKFFNIFDFLYLIHWFVIAMDNFVDLPSISSKTNKHRNRYFHPTYGIISIKLSLIIPQLIDATMKHRFNKENNYAYFLLFYFILPKLYTIFPKNLAPLCGRNCKLKFERR